MNYIFYDFYYRFISHCDGFLNFYFYYYKIELTLNMHFKKNCVLIVYMIACILDTFKDVSVFQAWSLFVLQIIILMNDEFFFKDNSIHTNCDTNYFVAIRTGT